MRVLFTGSRHWGNSLPVSAIISTLPSDAIVIHGAAKGLDTIAGRIAKNRWLTVESYPADWSRYGKSAGIRRNEYMASLGAHMCFAFPLQDSKGTKHMIAHARSLHIPVFIYDFR
tara:strand:- start:48 stop:392 length:345 start_codon:yes stop_codon:yes gene_type:complete